MRVLEHGYHYNNIRFHCNLCGCIFEAERMTETCLHPADDLNPPYYTANCPECGNECWTVSLLCYHADTKTIK